MLINTFEHSYVHLHLTPFVEDLNHDAVIGLSSPVWRFTDSLSCAIVLVVVIL